MRTLGVLLAGGRGRRLGGAAPKALVRCGGETLLARALGTLAALCDDVVVVAPGPLALPVPGARRLDDPPGADGPLAALAAGLAAAPFDEALALAVDLPLAGAPTLAALRALRAGSPAVVPAPGGRPQPLAAWYTPGAARALAAAHAAGERAVTQAALAAGARVVGDDALAALPGGLDAWLNVNTPEDLALAERRLATEPRA